MNKLNFPEISIKLKDCLQPMILKIYYLIEFLIIVQNSEMIFGPDIAALKVKVTMQKPEPVTIN